MVAASALDRSPGLRRLGAVLLVVSLIAAGLAACSTPAGSAGPSGAAGPTAVPVDVTPTPAPAGLTGFDPGLDVRPEPVPGPDLGVAEVAPMDPELMVPSPYGLIPSDRLWFLLPEGSTEADARRVADQMGGSVGGRIEVADLWLILIPPQSPEGILFALEFAGQIPGIDAVFPDVEMQAAADCAPGLSTGIYAGGRADPYAMIGVANAWQILYASGVPRQPVHVGLVDSVLTRDPQERIPWEFDNVTWVGEPVTTTTLSTNAKGQLSNGGFHHADGVLGQIAGDPYDGGLAGIASPLGGNLLVSHGAYASFKDNGGNMDPDVEYDFGGRVGHVSGILVEVKRQIERGATIVNLSVGPAEPDAMNRGKSAMWRRFLAKMQKEHPAVLFVAAAGNEAGVLDGDNYGPGGIAAPNLITVGSIQTDGTATSYSNKADPAEAGAEVTVRAPGDQAVWGTGADGKVWAEDGGTSSATPMVTATAALIRSLDPSLTAAEIKQRIVDAGDSKYGGYGGADVLRVDRVLRTVVDEVRARSGKLPLTDEEIAGAACELEVWGEATGESTAPAGVRWQVGARLPVIANATAVTLTIGGGGRPTDWRKAITAAGQEVGWSLLVPTAGADITVTRLDNGYWRQFHLRGALATPTPAPTPTATPRPTPTPTPADPGYDCSNPPTPGTIAYMKWSLHCKPIAP